MTRGGLKSCRGGGKIAQAKIILLPLTNLVLRPCRQYDGATILSCDIYVTIKIGTWTIFPLAIETRQGGSGQGSSSGYKEDSSQDEETGQKIAKKQPRLRQSGASKKRVIGRKTGKTRFLASEGPFKMGLKKRRGTPIENLAARLDI